MKASKIHTYCEKALLYLICFPCLYFAIKLAKSLHVGLVLIVTAPLTRYTAANGVIVLGHLILILLLLYFCYVTFSILNNFPIARPAFFDRWLRIPQLHALVLSASAQRNRYLVLFATLGTLIFVFYWTTVTAVLYWSAALLLFIYLIRWKNSPNSGVPTLAYLSFCVLLCIISLYRQQNYSLFAHGMPMVFAVLCSLLFVGAWLLLKIRRVPSGSTVQEWHISLLTLGSFAFAYYFFVVLSTLNCYYDPMTEHTHYTATVLDKVDPYDGKYHLCVAFEHDQKGTGTLMRVPPNIYKKVQIGGTIRMHLHPGVFGWAWHHDNMHTRERSEK